MVAKIVNTRFFLEMLWMVDFILAIYKRNTPSENPTRIELFHFYSLLGEYVLKGGFVCYVLAAMGYFVYPAYMYFFEGEIVTVLPLYIPTVDNETFKGYLIATSFHCLVIVLCFFGTTGNDFLFALIIINSPMMAALVKDEVNTLNAGLTKKTLSRADVFQRQRNILKMHSEYST